MTQPVSPIQYDKPEDQFADRSGGNVVFESPEAQFERRTLEGKPKPAAAIGAQIGLPPVPNQALADQAKAGDLEQARLEAEHGRIATMALQGAKGVLDGLTAPGALVGLGAEGLGSALGVKSLEDFGRGLGDASTGESAMQALAFGFSSDDANARHFDAFDKTKEVIRGQQKAWPTLSTVSNIAGRVGFAVGTGSLATAGESGAAEVGSGLVGTARSALAQGTAALGNVGTQATMGAVEGGAMGAQAAYEKQAPLRDVITSTLLGAAMGGGTAALPALVKTDTAKRWLENFSNERTFKAIGGTAAQVRSMAKRYGIAEEKIADIAETMQKTTLEDGTPIFKALNTPAEHLDLINKARDEVGAKLGALRSSADDVLLTHPELAPDIATTAGKIESDVIAPLKKLKITEAQAGPVQDVVDDLRAMIPKAEGATETAKVPGWTEFLKGKMGPAMKAHGGSHQEAIAELSAQYKALKATGTGVATSAETGAEAASTRGTIKQLFEYRTRLDDKLYPLRQSAAQGIMGAKETLKGLEQARGIIEDAIGDATEKAAGLMKSEAAYTALKKQYAGLSVARDIASEATASRIGQRFASGSDTLVGAATFAGGLAGGSPTAALKGLAATFMHKALREKSSGLLAVISRRLAGAGEEGAGTALAAGALGAENEGLKESAGGILESGVASTQKFGSRKAESAFAEKAFESPFEVGHHVAQEHVTEHIIRHGETAEIPVHVAGGRESQQVLTTLSNAQNQARSVEQSAGPNPDMRQQARSRANVETSQALANAAGHYDPAQWSTQTPTPIQRVVYRSALLDHMAPELSQSLAGLPKPGGFQIDPDRIAKLTQDANGPQAIGNLQQALEGLLAQVPPTVDGDAIGYQIRVARQALTRADVPNAMVIGHGIANQLGEMSGRAPDPTSKDYAQRSSAAVRDVLSSDVFGSAGQAYRTATSTQPDPQLQNLEDPAVMRNFLRQAASRGILTKPLNDQKRMALGAALAMEQLSGQRGLAKTTEQQYKDAVDKASKAENAVTLDGGPMGKVFDYFHSQIDNRVVANLGDDLTQVTARAVRPEVSRVLPALRRQAMAASDPNQRPPRLNKAQQIQQYQDRVQTLQQFSSDPNTDYINAGMKVFHGVTDDLQNAVGQDMGQKMQQLMADLPKPRHTLQGPAYDSLSSEELRLANSMWEATTDPTSIFADFERGHVDYDKIQYVQKQYPGLTIAHQAGLMDMLTEHLSDKERSGIPDYVLTQVDHLFGLGGRLQSTASPDFSAHIAAMAQQQAQQQQQAPQQGGNLELPAYPSLTERLARGRG